MKFFAVAIVALLFVSCNKENEIENPLDRPNQVRFSATVGNGVATPRVSGTDWTAGNAIGVFALNAGQSLTTAGIFDDASNIRFTTNGSGNFIVGNQSEAIIFPATGNLDFIAYYPFSPDVTEFTLPINVSDQSDQTKIDVLYSNNATGYNNANHNVQLQFARKMAQLVFNVANGDGVPSLAGLTVEIDGLATEGSMNLANGDITLSTTGNITVVPVIASDNLSAQAISIMLPTQNLSTATVRFTLNGQVFNWTPPAQIIASGMRYTYNFQLSTTGLEELNPTGSIIDDWQDGNDPNAGDNVLMPSQFTTDVSVVNLAFTDGATGEVVLTALGTQAWTAESNQPWLTISPESGDGGATIVFTAELNADYEREATVTIIPTAPTTEERIYITVIQAENSNEPVIIFNETFGTPSGTTSVATFTGWTTTGVDVGNVSFVGTGADIRITTPSISGVGPWYPGASGDGNVFFAAAGGTFWINDIGVCGTENLFLSFGTQATNAMLTVSYSIDGTNWIPIPFTKASTQWGLVDDLPITLPSGTDSISLRFVMTTSGSGARLDDVTIITYDATSGC
ncbi:MAG: fimbrillin family protein [Dysgonamonadaceae bacterium]|nr:fimbrillin family protein [Dysgonamonadaceae bacterium]